MRRSVVIIGAGGHAKVIADIIRSSGDSVRAFLVEEQYMPEGASESRFVDAPLYGGLWRYKDFSDCEFMLGIGDSLARERIAESMPDVRWYTAVHPSAVVSSLAELGCGTVVMPNAVVNAGARVGKHCIVNTEAVVEHDNTVMDYAHISVGAKLGGWAVIGTRSWIGLGANVRDHVTVCGDCMVGVGAAVVRNITEAGTYVGVPARRM